MIVTADWVLPVARGPIRDGAVFMSGPRIAEVGPLGEVRAAHPRSTVTSFDGCVIVPGLVNAHTHLSLHALRTTVPGPDPSYLLRCAGEGVRSVDTDHLAASCALGAVECLRKGVTSVGDVAYGPEPLAACADIGVGGVFFWETLGLDASDLEDQLAGREFPVRGRSAPSGRGRWGISVHSSYAACQDLLCASHELARSLGVRFTIRAAESRAERELMVSGTGPLAPVARRLANGFRPPGVGSVAYLDGLGLLADALLVHCTSLEPGDFARMQRHARAVVLCPRSDERLGNGEPPAAELLASGPDIALGTDAPGDDDLDLLAEARELRRLVPTIAPRRLIEMMTIGGARALGIDDATGSLEPGKRADLAVFAADCRTDPESALVAGCGADGPRAVISDGLWRVREGEISFPVHTIEDAAARARGPLRSACGA